MTVASFSMGDLQDVWEQGGRNAYFANNFYGQPAGGMATSTPRPATPLIIPTNAPAATNTPAKTIKRIRVTNAKGRTFMKTIEGNAEKAYNATKRGVAGAGNLAGRAASGTAGYASRGVEAAGRGAVNAGGFVRDRANQLSGTIQKNPRIAGAVILGGTALGVGGGAYALSRRGDN